MSSRSALPLILTAMFLFASALALVGPVEETVEERIALNAEPANYGAPSPGHTVFMQYISSDNCVYCYNAGGGSESAHNLKQSNPDEFVYITYSSLDFGSTNDARSGNVAPIYAMNHLGETGGAPTAYLGDSDPEVSGSDGQGTRYDSTFSAGGNMHASAADYAIAVQQSVNSTDPADVDIMIQAAYVGTGTPPASTKLYAAVTEEKCGYTYNGGNPGYAHNCWRAWLLNGNSYATTSGTTGGGTGFITMNLQNGPHTEMWTIPGNIVRAQGGNSAGIDNMLTIGAIFSTWSTTAHNHDVYAAGDSSMQPLIDVGIDFVTVANQDGSAGFVSGDTVDLSVTVRNRGAEAYNDGGTIGLYYLQGNQENLIDTTSLNSLTKNGASDTQTFQTTFDTTSITTVSHGQTAFRARLTSLTGDGNAMNNFAQEYISHDMPPGATLPTAVGEDTVITRQPNDVNLSFELKPSINDAVDDVSTMTGSLEVKDLITGAWSDAWVTGGDEVFGQGESAHLKFTVHPPNDAKAGEYDVRTMWTDSRGQSSAWIEYADAFSLMNGLPAVVDGVVPTVKVDTDERISLVGIVSDPETPLNQLQITSTASEFTGWYPADMEIGVRFASDDQTKDASGNYMQQNLQITMDDGTDSNTGTIKINLIENGAPRWSPVQAITMEEGGSTTIALAQYLSDTDDSGQTAPVSALTIQVISNNADGQALITTTVNGQTLVLQTIDDDAHGSTLLTLRAHDGVRHSDTEMMVHVTNVNDAPRLDSTPLENLRVKAGEYAWIDMSGRITDVDTDAVNLWIDVSSDVSGGAKWFPANETLRLRFDVEGMKTFSFSLDDNEGGVANIPVTVEVVDALPLTWEQDGVGDLSIATDTLDTGSTPRVTVLNVGPTTLTEIEVNWQLCNSITKQCTDAGREEQFGAFDVVPQSGLGLRLADYLKVTVTGVDSDGFDRKSTEMVFNATEAADDVSGDGSTTDGTGDDGTSTQTEEGMSLSSPAAIGGIVVFILLALTLALTFVMRGGKRDELILSAYAQQLVEQGYTAEVAQAHAAMYEQHASQSETAAPMAPTAATPTTVTDYTHLPAGGDYRTGYQGETIYVEPSGVAWTMQADNSFIRNQ